MTQSMESGHIPSTLIDEAGASFFAEYVRRAAPELSRYLGGEPISKLDVYAVSSRAIIGILEDASCKPTWTVPLRIDDYFGEDVVCQRVSKSLKRYFVASRPSFERNVRDDQLIVRCAPGVRNAEGILRDVAMMLPPRFEAEHTPGMLTCRLQAIECLCGVQFTEKDSWWQRLWE